MASDAHVILDNESLRFLKLSIQVRHRHLIEESTLLTLNGVRSPETSLRIRTRLPAMHFEHLLSEFPALTCP